MTVNIALGFLGTIAVSAIALPAQAGVLTYSIDGSTAPLEQAAYKITNLEVIDTVTPSKSGFYDVSFNYGDFATLYQADTSTNPFTFPASAYAGSFADALGAAIVAALPENAKILAANVANGGSNVKMEFFIPKSLEAQNGNQDTFLQCFTSSDTCPAQFITPDSFKDVYFAQYSAAVNPPTGTVPTPALIPGILGMGLAALRKKKQAA